MPRKKSQPQPEESPKSSARLQAVPIDKITEERKQIHSFLLELDAVLEEAGELGIESIEIDGAMKFERAKDLIDEFVGKAINGLRKARRQAPKE